MKLVRENVGACAESADTQMVNKMDTVCSVRGALLDMTEGDEDDVFPGSRASELAERVSC